MTSRPTSPVPDESAPLEVGSRAHRGFDSLVTPIGSRNLARVTLSVGQKATVGAIVLAVIAGCAIDWVATAQLLLGLATTAYLLTTVFRLVLVRIGMTRHQVLSVSDRDARAAVSLPRYTVLVPAYNEPRVVTQLIDNLGGLDYPPNLLEIILLLEADDLSTRAEVDLSPLPSNMRVLTVPGGGPRTKPNACNHGLRQASGVLVTIFDAEDQPDPLQLRRAAVAFRGVDASVACLQAKLSYFNSGQNLITRWFALEYLIWFEHLLPGLVGASLPVPLGGTSNHFRAEVLKELGGWDPFNVTEDADLGICLAERGYRTAVLDSTTLEEANSDFVNWLKQRSRWYKGYLLTWLVYLRKPARTVRQLGIRGTVGLTLFVGGTPLLAVLNPVFWALTAVWLVARPAVFATLFPAWVYYPAILSLTLGNSMTYYSGFLSARAEKRPDLTVAAATFPLYWVMMSIAATKALVQLVVQPTYWEKTAHGLSGPRAANPVPVAEELT